MAVDKKSRGPRPESPPPCDRRLVSDTTVEALVPILEANPRGVVLEMDELSGWLRSFNEYKGGRGKDVPHYLSMHRAGLRKIGTA